MKYRVYFSEFATEKLDRLIPYLEKEWGIPTKNNFLEKLNSSLDKLESFLKSSIKSSYFKGVYKFVVTTRISYFYIIKGRDVEIITLTDNRQNPKMIHEELIALFNKQ